VTLLVSGSWTAEMSTADTFEIAEPDSDSRQS